MTKLKKHSVIKILGFCLVIFVSAFVGGIIIHQTLAESEPLTWSVIKKPIAPYTTVPGQLPRGSCPPGMVWVPAGKFCIDKYEASNGGGSYKVDINQDGDFDDNVNVYGDGTMWNEATRTISKAVSVPNANPWVNINQVDAKAACLAAGKRLATNYEWLLAAKGTPDPRSSDPGDDSEECNIWANSKPAARTWVTENQAVKTMEGALCVSSVGAYDMIGNVWEWTDDVILDGKHPVTGSALPGQNYIRGLDIYGLPTTTGSSMSEYNYDHFWINATGYRGFLRGGDWYNGARAGVFALTLDDGASSASTGIGFRCAR